MAVAGAFVLIACVASLDAQFTRAKPPLPPLLRGLTAGGAWPCPGVGDAPKTSNPTEFDKRLAHEFPSGSRESSLLGTLAALGFQPSSPPCGKDASIRMSRFTQSGGGGLSFPMTAFVFWKVDRHGDVLWVTGDVGFTGP